MMPHCRHGASSVSRTNFLNHVGKGAGHFGTFFDAILMTPPRHQNEDLRHMLAVWDCLTRRNASWSWVNSKFDPWHLCHGRTERLQCHGCRSISGPARAAPGRLESPQ
jgi:hypothetical protein